VLGCHRWWQCRLPKSVNTIAEDMRLDLPADRLASYAAFLNIPIELLQAEDLMDGSEAFTKAIFQAREVSDALNLPLFGAFSENFCQQYYRNNPTSYIKSLYKLVYGIYELQVYLPPSPEIWRGCIMVHDCQEHLLRASVFMVMLDTEIHYDAILYRWGNNLHISYYSLDMFIYGRLLGVDPLRHFAISQHRPFSLNLTGVSDLIVGPQSYGIVQTRVEQTEQPEAKVLPERWLLACHKVRTSPHILPSHPEYPRLLALVCPSPAEVGAFSPIEPGPRRPPPGR